LDNLAELALDYKTIIQEALAKNRETTKLKNTRTVTAKDIEKEITALEALLPEEPKALENQWERQDTRPFWTAAKTIQDHFNKGVHCSSQAERKAVWERFNNLRHTASERGRAREQMLAGRSEGHRETILQRCAGIGRSGPFCFDQTTIQQMKGHNQSLREAMGYFKAHKHEMTGPDKTTCHQRICTVLAEQEEFWKRLKKRPLETGKTWEEHYTENVAKNRERLEKTTAALERTQARCRDLEEKLARYPSETWRERLAEGQRRCQSIVEEIARLEKWIAEDTKRLERG
jgi:hypothetical protein